MLLRDVAPNFRCATYGNTTYVEIPQSYGAYLPSQLPAELVDNIRKTIYNLARKCGNGAPVFDEQKQAGKRQGWLIPMQDWDFAMNQPVSGWVWKDD